ncbi:MAG: DUF2520 domain-containing protein [Acidobacteriota bacterium]|nr:MAG: DUF2520 domain-containing protein [Acidobacteriota bacterium]
MSRRASSPYALESVGVAGAGRAGSALVVALRARGESVVVWSRRPARARALARRTGARATSSLGALLGEARLLLVAVRDDALAEFAEVLARDWPRGGGPRVALHLAGSRPAAALAPLAELGPALGVFHPVVALVGPRSAQALEGRFVTLSGQPRAVRRARRLARRLGLRPLVVEDDQRALVHLAAVMAAGDLVALLTAAASLLERAGLSPRAARRLLAELATSAVQGFEDRGLDALTGPVARGDVETLARHVEALARADLDDGPLSSAHRELVLAGAAELVAAGRLPRRVGRQLAVSLTGRDLPAPARLRTLPRREDLSKPSGAQKDEG